MCTTVQSKDGSRYLELFCEDVFLLQRLLVLLVQLLYGPLVPEHTNIV